MCAALALNVDIPQNGSTLWSHLVGAWNTAKDFVIAHPRLIASAILVLALAIVVAQPGVATGVVHFLGFGTRGISAGSIAAHVQSVGFGGSVPANSFFAFLQSFGTRM